MILSSVVLPAPFAPTSATLAPSPTRNDTSSSSTRPSGSSYRTPWMSTCPTRSDSHTDSSAVSLRFSPLGERTNRLSVDSGMTLNSPYTGSFPLRSAEDARHAPSCPLLVDAHRGRDQARDERGAKDVPLHRASPSSNTGRRPCSAPPGRRTALGVRVDVVATQDEDVAELTVVGEARDLVVAVSEPTPSDPAERRREEVARRPSLPAAATSTVSGVLASPAARRSCRKAARPWLL